MRRLLFWLVAAGLLVPAVPLTVNRLLDVEAGPSVRLMSFTAYATPWYALALLLLGGALALGWAGPRRVVAPVAAVVAVLLIAFTQFGLLALMLVALASGVGLLGQVMPARTAKGSAALAGLGVLRGTLLTQPTDEMPKGREHEELGSVLPYAVVLGGADRWLDAIAAVDDPALDDATELSWYHGPDGWKLTDLPDSLRNFVRAFQGTLVGRG